MKRFGPEIVSASGLKGLRIEFGEFADRLLDGSLDAVLGAHLGESFTDRTGTKTMQMFDLPPESKVRDDLGGHLADGSECAGVGVALGHGRYASPPDRPPSWWTRVNWRFHRRSAMALAGVALDFLKPP